MSARDEAELAAGSGDEKTCMPSPDCLCRDECEFAPVQPPAPDHAACEAETFGERKERDYWRERCDVMAKAFGDMRALLTEYRATGYEPAPYSQERALVERMEGLLSLTPAPPPAPDPDETCPTCGLVQVGRADGKCRAGCTPAPDPDETTFFWDKATGEPCPRSENVLCALPWTDEHRHTHTPPATTGPADEAERLEVAIQANRWVDGVVCGYYETPEIAEQLATRDAAQQRIGAEKAWDRAHDLLCTRGFAICPIHGNPYRADRIAREGRADV